MYRNINKHNVTVSHCVSERSERMGDFIRRAQLRFIDRAGERGLWRRERERRERRGRKEEKGGKREGRRRKEGAPQARPE